MRQAANGGILGKETKRKNSGGAQTLGGRQNGRRKEKSLTRFGAAESTLAPGKAWEGVPFFRSNLHQKEWDSHRRKGAQGEEGSEEGVTRKASV